MSYTKGPWNYDTDPKNYGQQIFINGNEGTVLIAEMNHKKRLLVGKPEDVEADARVIAAAVSLLEACQAAEAHGEMLPDAKALEPGGSFTGHRFAIPEAQWEAVRAAVKKALGR